MQLKLLFFFNLKHSYLSLTSLTSSLFPAGSTTSIKRVVLWTAPMWTIRTNGLEVDFFPLWVTFCCSVTLCSTAIRWPNWRTQTGCFLASSNPTRPKPYGHRWTKRRRHGTKTDCTPRAGWWWRNSRNTASAAAADITSRTQGALWGPVASCWCYPARAHTLLHRGWWWPSSQTCSQWGSIPPRWRSHRNSTRPGMKNVHPLDS